MTSKEVTGLQRSTLIDAPVEKVFAYYSEPQNLPEIWPSLLEVRDVERTAAGWAKTFKWVYK
nr:SRPBCC family protein [Deinococcota bacterium]